MGNTSLSGGFQAVHADDGTVCRQVTDDGLVLVDGIEYRAGEAHFGGIVVQPEALERVSVGAQGILGRIHHTVCAP